MFGIFKAYRNVKKGVRDPGGLGQELALDVIRTPLVVLTVIGVLFFVALFILAFTGVLGGPFGFFKIVFWVLVVPFALFELIVWYIFGKIRKLTDMAKRKVNERMNIVDGEIQ